MGTRFESVTGIQYRFLVQDTKLILETIGGPAPQRREDYKPDKSGDSKEGTLEIAEADMKDRTEESPKSGIEQGRKPTRKRSKRRKIQLSEEGKKVKRLSHEALHPDNRVVRGHPP